MSIHPILSYTIEPPPHASGDMRRSINFGPVKPFCPPDDASARAPNTCLLRWDMRKPPEFAHIVDERNHLPSSLLCNNATFLAEDRLRIKCGILSGSWTFGDILVKGDKRIIGRVVTVGAVLNAIYSYLSQRISEADWAQMELKKQRKVSEAFTKRCNLNTDEITYQNYYNNGALRVDCLMEHCWFGGLTLVGEEYIMSLRRARPGQW